MNKDTETTSNEGAELPEDLGEMSADNSGNSAQDETNNTESLDAQESTSTDNESRNGHDENVLKEQVAEQQLLQQQTTIKALKAELENQKQNFLRVHADFENTKKRMLREKEQSIRYANQKLLLDVVAFIDDWERALSLMVENDAATAFMEGLQLIEKQFLDTLGKRWGLASFGNVGDQFDPNCHEAFGIEAAQDGNENTVREIYQRGYTLHGRLLRSAKVKVAQVLSTADAEPATEAQTYDDVV